jgi:exonuclease III
MERCREKRSICVQETKITNEKHATRAGNFDIIASETSTRNRGGVAFFVRRQATDGDALAWCVEDPKVYETNVVGITVVSGKLRRRLIGLYLSPSEISEETWEALRQACDEAVDPIWLLGDFNVDLHSLQAVRLNAAQNSTTDTRSAEVQAFVASMGCENFGHTKLQRRKTGVWTWSMKRVVNGAKQHIKSICDYILGPKNDPVQTHRVQTTTFISTDHRVVYLDLRVLAAEHREYVRGRKRFPSMKGPKSAVDIEYAELIELQEKQKMQRWSARPSWISDSTWALIKLRQATNSGNVGWAEHKRLLKRTIKRMLKHDRMQWYDDEAKLIEEAMAQNDSKAGFQLMQKWCKKKSGVQLPMSHRRHTTVSTKYTALYAAQQPTKPMFSLKTSIAQQFEVVDEPLTSDEIRAAAKRMKSGKVPGPSRFRGDTIKRWALADEGTSDTTCFEKLASLCEHIFLTGEIPQAMKEGDTGAVAEAGKGRVPGFYFARRDVQVDFVVHERKGEAGNKIP